jgi:hypothetical protein
MKDELLELMANMTDAQLSAVIEKLPEDQREHLSIIAQEYGEALKRERGQQHFMDFVKAMWPNFIGGRHHEIMAKAFERVAKGELKRLIINMPPRHTKSEFASYLLPAWFLGKYPNKKIIQSSNTAELAVGFGRKVRNLVDGEIYSKVFPNVALRHDSKAAGRWSTNSNGEYFAIGVGGTVTGKGADLLIIDDPHSEQEAKLAESDPSVFDSVYEWYTSGPRQRLQPGGAIVVVMCMTGDTDVLMADGSTAKLKDIRQGDEVATYEDGKITTAKIKNQRSNGVDSVFTIKTQSGKIIRANKRHPFLVDFAGERKWARLQDLTPGMLLVATKIVRDPQDRKQNPDCVQLANPALHTTKKTPTRHTIRPDTTANGKELFAKLKGVLAQLRSKVSARLITTNSTFHPKARQKRTGKGESSTGTGLRLTNTKRWLYSGATDVMSVASRLLQKIPAHTGTANFVSTIATIPAMFAVFFATIATSLLGTEKPQKCLKKPLSIYDVTADQIISITPNGEEEVFDVEVERTENFIANGVVSHNTRWSKRDLTGRVLKDSAQRGGDEWELIEFPAILPSNKPLWPEFWSYEELDALRVELPNSKWQAQYQQDPTSEGGAIVKREWWRVWEEDRPPPCEFIIQSWDTAFLKSERADYSACTTWGVFDTTDDSGRPQNNIILLNAFKKRMEFPELKQRAYQEFKEWEVDSLIVEAKAAGSPLIFELRAMGIPVQEFTPTRGNDKIARLNAVADIFASGMVWVPNTHWAE